MKATKLCTGEWWDVQNLDIPQRSSLYSLEPIGIGTAQVESLTGYMQRLAYEHCLSTWMLVSRKIAPSVDREYLSENTERNLSSFFSRGNQINGVGSIAQDWVQALETLTGRTDLKFLTMLSYADILPIWKLFRKERAWCPHCYADWFLQKQPPYEPLLWSLNAANLCIQHKEPLHNSCPHCNQKNSILSRQLPLDYCCKCGKWLGNNTPQTSQINEVPNEELSYAIWTTNNIGSLLASAPNCCISRNTNAIAVNISKLVEHITQGNKKKFARELQLPTWVVQLTSSGEINTNLTNLLRICYQLNIPLMSLISPDFDIVDAIDYNSSFFLKRKKLEETQVTSDNLHCRKKNLDQGEIRRRLKALLESDSPPPSLAKIAREVGCVVKTLRYHASDLCDQIVQRRQELRDAGINLNAGSLIRSISSKSVELLTSEELRDRLLSCLEEDVPRNVQEVAEELGYSMDILYDHHADLCYRITKRWKNYQSESRKKNLEQACDEVRRAVLQLHSQGKHISTYTVRKLLSKPAYLRDEEVYSLLAALKKQLEE